jgi:hypothetical protein
MKNTWALGVGVPSVNPCQDTPCFIIYTLHLNCVAGLLCLYGRSLLETVFCNGKTALVLRCVDGRSVPLVPSGYLGEIDWYLGERRCPVSTRATGRRRVCVCVCERERERERERSLTG